MKPSTPTLLSLFTAMLLLFFGAAFVSGDVFGFRDSGHYYFRLFAWCQQQWGNGSIPLWNPQENLGTPILADASSGVFYPGKLVFALPLLDYARQYVLYIALHVALAGVTAFFLARTFNASPGASAIGALSYAFGGPVLTQCSNAIFLVGAAWLPLALLALVKMCSADSRQGALQWTITLSAILALITLGGDPQCAYHVIIAGALLLWRFPKRHFADTASPPPLPSRWYQIGTRRIFACQLGIAIAGGLALSAVQVVPSSQWSRQSSRANTDQPRSLYEFPSYLSRTPGVDTDADSPTLSTGLEHIFSEPQGGTHLDHVYQFSLAPWSLGELIWPNSSGRLMPQHQRWLTMIPGSDRTWFPSLYIGLIPILLALSTINFRRKPAKHSWLFWLLMFFGLGSLGWYGVGWLTREIAVGVFSFSPHALKMGSPVGGLYWLLTTCLPGYVMFRYPAKLWLFASLAISIMAAIGWDRLLVPKNRQRLSWLAAAICGVSLTGLVFVWFFAQSIQSIFETIATDAVFGPFNSIGAFQDLSTALLTTAWISLFMTAACRKLSPRTWRSPSVVVIAIIVTCFDLGIANRWILAIVNGDAWSAPSPIAKKIEKSNRAIGSIEHYRTFRGHASRWLPSQWSVESSSTRMEEVVRWDSETLVPKHQLATSVWHAESNSSIASADLDTFFAFARGRGFQRADQVYEPSLEVLGQLAVRHLIMPELGKAGESEMGAAIRMSVNDEPENSSLWLNPHVQPRAYIVHQVRPILAIEKRSPHALIKQTQQVFDENVFESQSTSGWRAPFAVVETSSPDDFPLGETTTPVDLSHCEFLVDDPNRIEIEVESKAPGFLVLNDFHDGSWVATISTEGGPTQAIEIYRTNRIMRGVVVPQGKSLVTFQYRPLSLQLGGTISVLSWIGLIGFVCFLINQNRQKNQVTSRSE